MLKRLRQNIIHSLWQTYQQTAPQMQTIEQGLRDIGQQTFTLDHFAIIDLPSPHSGIPPLSKLFSALGYVPRGQDYLAEKQNDFLWMGEADCGTELATSVLPQIVVADFRPEEMPTAVRHIIQHYAQQTKPLDFHRIEALIQQVQQGCTDSASTLHQLYLDYLQGRDWPLPTLKEFQTVHEFNELLAWVLVFGRKPNHFTLSIHLMEKFSSLTAFHQFIEQDLGLPLNTEGGVIKGGKHVGIEQGSTLGRQEPVVLADGIVHLPTGFVEFVWRFPSADAAKAPRQWNEYFTHFIAQHANKVIESLL